MVPGIICRGMRILGWSCVVLRSFAISRGVVHRVRHQSYFFVSRLVKQLKAVQLTAAKKVLVCSSTTSNTVLRAGLGMYPLKANTLKT